MLNFESDINMTKSVKKKQLFFILDKLHLSIFIKIE